MKNDHPGDEEARKTLSILDQMDRAEADPYFATRLTAQLEQTQSSRAGVWKLHWATVGLLLLLNAAFISWKLHTSHQESSVSDVVSMEYRLQPSRVDLFNN